MLIHDGFDSLGGLLSVIEWNCRNVVVKDVAFNDAVEEVSADEAEVSIDGGSGAPDECPCVVIVMGERRVRVLEECNCH